MDLRFNQPKPKPNWGRLVPLLLLRTLIPIAVAQGLHRLGVVPYGLVFPVAMGLMSFGFAVWPPEYTGVRSAGGQTVGVSRRMLVGLGVGLLMAGFSALLWWTLGLPSAS